MGGLFSPFSLLPVLGLEDPIFPFDLLCFSTFKVDLFNASCFSCAFFTHQAISSASRLCSVWCPQLPLPATWLRSHQLLFDHTVTHIIS